MVADLSNLPTATTILTPDTTFEDTYLIEVSRGCPHGCRFCSAGYVYRPPRFRPLALLDRQVDEGAALTDRIGLVGAAVSDLPCVRELCGRERGKAIHFAFSSLRADALDEPLIEALRQGRVKTATIAPDAGSERMRRVINKGVTEAHVLAATETLVAAGIPNLKVYFMVGLPTETDADVAAIVELVKRVKHVFLKTSRGKGRMGEITVSLSSFVPKPFTPFQWAAMDTVKQLKGKIKTVQNGLRKTANVRVYADLPRWAYVQGLIARGDRRVADILLLAHHYQGNWPQTFKASPVNPHFTSTANADRRNGSPGNSSTRALIVPTCGKSISGRWWPVRRHPVRRIRRIAVFAGSVRERPGRCKRLILLLSRRSHPAVRSFQESLGEMSE